MARLPDDLQAVFVELQNELHAVRPTLALLDRYYDGEQYLQQLGLAIPPQLQSFTVIVNFTRIVADARADRLDVKGFRLPGNDTGDADLWRLWQRNQMDELDLMARLDYQVYGRSFHCVGANPDRPALITVESPYEVVTRRDRATGDVTHALRLYRSSTDAVDDDRATLYTTEGTYWLALSHNGWVVEDAAMALPGRVGVVPAFRGRRSAIPLHAKTQGVSAMKDVIPIVNAAARNLTNVQVAQETHAVPARWVAGMSKGDFVDKDGNLLPTWVSYFGAIQASKDPNTKFGQYESSDMKNFETMDSLYARKASSVTGLRPDYFGLTADQAASADAIRAGDTRLIKSVERDQVVLGNAREESMRLMVEVATGERPPILEELECLWYDAGTPTYASRADAVTKLWAATNSQGKSLISTESALEELGWSPQRIQRELERLASEQTDPYLSAQDTKTSVEV